MNRGVVGVLVAGCVLAGAACGDDDDVAPTSTGPPTTVGVDSTLGASTSSPPPTTEAVTTVAPTTSAAPPTTVDEAALKAQIAADYLRSWDLRRELTMNPTLENLDARVAQISAAGSADAANLSTLVNELVRLGEHVRPGDPDLTRIDVEKVDLVGSSPHQEAIVTICYIRNLVRVDAAGSPVLDVGTVASRSEDHVVKTDNGWLPDTGFSDLWQGLGVTECPSI